MTTRFSILLVEHDLREVRRVLDALDPEPRQERVIVTQEASKAITFLEEHRSDRDGRPGLLLLDLDLPGQGCVEVLDVLRSDRELRSIPAVVLTSSCKSEPTLRAYERGAHSCVQKPFDLEKLHKAAQGIERYWQSLFPLAD